MHGTTVKISSLGIILTSLVIFNTRSLLSLLLLLYYCAKAYNSALHFLYFNGDY